MATTAATTTGLRPASAHRPHYYQKPPPPKLDVNAVRRRAAGVVGCKEVPSSGADAAAAAFGSSSNSSSNGGNEENAAQQHVVSFLVGLPGERQQQRQQQFVVGADHDDGDGDDGDHLARVTVFGATGTVAVARVLNGEIRTAFRRNVSTLDSVERLLRYPPQLARVDKSVVGLTDVDEEEKDVAAKKQRARALPRTRMLRTEIELADVGLAILQAEKEKLESHLEAAEEDHKRQQQQQQKTNKKNKEQIPPVPIQSASESMSSSTADSRKGLKLVTDESQSSSSSYHSDNKRKDGGGEDSFSSTIHPGMEFQFSLPPQPMKHVDQCLGDINRMNKLVRSVATNGRGTVFLYGNGGVAYTPNIPRPLHHKLSQLRNSRMASRPSYVALGTRDRYFVTFHDGSFSCKGPKGLDRELKRLSKPPRSVSFGSSWVRSARFWLAFILIKDLSGPLNFFIAFLLPR